MGRKADLIAATNLEVALASRPSLSFERALDEAVLVERELARKIRDTHRRNDSLEVREERDQLILQLDGVRMVLDRLRALRKKGT